LQRILGLGCVLALGACTSVPHDGPSARDVERQVGKSSYAIVDLDMRIDAAIAGQPPVRLNSLIPAASGAATDLIGPGDLLAISIFETGSGPPPGGRTGTDSQQARTFPAILVDSSGSVSLPFAGEVQVAGLTPRLAGERVRAALKGRLVDPQVTLNVAASATNAVTVLGEVRNSGRFPLTPTANRLLDVVALAGGPVKAPGDTEVVVVRSGKTATAALTDVLRSPDENIRLAPQDQVQLRYRPRKFNTFGGFSKVSQIDIQDDSLTLAGAMSRIGGLDTQTANAQAVMVFRQERPEVARAVGVTVAQGAVATPIIYRLNLKDPSGFFVANEFEVRPNDIIYAPRADSAELKKFLDLVESLSRVAYDVTVTSVLP